MAHMAMLAMAVAWRGPICMTAGSCIDVSFLDEDKVQTRRYAIAYDRWDQQSVTVRSGMETTYRRLDQFENAVG
jgi:hypothetical protein